MRPWLVCLFVACGSDLPKAPGPKDDYKHLARIPKDQVDILFMLDDSSSTTVFKNELKARFPALLQRLDEVAAAGFPASYHFGVVTSDLGAGPGGSGGSGCAAGGLGGRLQALGRAHGPTCRPPVGGNYLEWDQLAGTTNAPTGVTLNDEFTCMASGGGGCGFEHVLESVYRALHDCPSKDACTIPENLGFLRPDALLVVVFVTDEDDCSGPPDTDLFDQDTTPLYGPRVSFRCTQYGVVCQQNGVDALPPYGDSGGPLPGCHGAPNPNGNLVGLPPPGEGKLFDVNRYLDFFHALKPDPRDLLFAAIDPPSEPFATFLGNGDTGAVCPSGAMVGTTGCQVYLGHSCNGSAQFFGDPAVRINQVVNAVDGSVRLSLCSQDYTPFLKDLGDAIAARVIGRN
jgi:hypothetical protein